MKAEKIRDNLLNANVSQVANGVMAIANTMQDYESHIQLASLAYSFIAWCNLTKQNPQDVFIAINNISTFHCGLRPEFKAVTKYLEKEVIK